MCVIFSIILLSQLTSDKQHTNNRKKRESLPH